MPQMTGSKLNPIYTALDSHQYNRAIKLAAALPDSNTLGKALLAHAYSKSGQKHQALIALQIVLGNFCELQLELEASVQASPLRQQSKVPPLQDQKISSKKGKKGKKKQITVVAKEQVSPSNEKEVSFIDRLDNQPSLPQKWEELPSPEMAIIDETTLATLSVTLQNMKLALTAYQMYAWAAKATANEEILTKAFSLGLTVLASPSKWDAASQSSIESHVLSQMQAVALQYARLVASQSPSNSFPMMLATGWASQAALWQLQWLPKDEKRELILPRLAESMARRLIEQEGNKSPSAEVRLLCLRILEHQSKFSEMLDLLDSDVKCNDSNEETGATAVSDFGVSMSWHQVQADKARILCLVGSYDKARSVYEDLLSRNPDDWACLNGHLKCSLEIDGTGGTEAFINTLLEQQTDRKYPIRGPHLMEVELAAHSFRSKPTEASLQELATSIVSYAQLFASRVSCAYSDLDAYIELLLKTDAQLNDKSVRSLLGFAEDLRKRNAPSIPLQEESNKEKQKRLRAYIFASKLNHKLLSFRFDLQEEYLVDWKELVVEWEQTLSLSSSNEGEETQKEIKPGDDLAVLAVHQLLYKNPGDYGVKVVCAALLEKAMYNSPDNAYLKIAAMEVYSQLDAPSRCWELFQAVGLKHIQLESCTYTILPCLLQGGLYNELVELCNLMLRFQTNTARDCGDYAGRAMNSGIMSKADEFMMFQRQNMNKSVSVMEAKGMILDAASLLGEPVEQKRFDEDVEIIGRLGLHQGIVGAESDTARVPQMVAEVHNPFAALSLISWANTGGTIEDSGDMADNRDASILSHQILYKTTIASKESIARESLRRGHTHGLLLRVTICLDATKAPKKGKIVSSSEELETRTQSLLRSVELTSSFISASMDGDEYKSGRSLLCTSLDLCRVIATIVAGLPNLDNDSLEAREIRSSDILEGNALSHLKEAAEALSLSSVKDVLLIFPSYVLPLFSLFRMLSNVCGLFGWGRRKRKTKRCASAVADFAFELSVMIQDLLSVFESLPSSATTPCHKVSVPKEYLEVIDADILVTTTASLTMAQYRTRLRIEPILQEMNEFLKSFDVADN